MNKVSINEVSGSRREPYIMIEVIIIKVYRLKPEQHIMNKSCNQVCAYTAQSNTSKTVLYSLPLIQSLEHILH